jgi:FkbM family methyltransferase
MKNSLSKCSIVFDVGAHVGNWTKLALRTNRNIILHCFEPSAKTFHRLISNNFSSNVICNNFGLSNVAEQKTLFTFYDCSGENSLYERHGLEDGWGVTSQQGREIVKLMTLDDYCQCNNIEKIDFLKIDVEGHELKVLMGAGNLLKEERVKIIQFEYNRTFIDARTYLADIFVFFDNFNYSLFKIFPKNLKYIKRYDQRLENFQYANYAAILNGLECFPKELVKTD